MNLSLNERYDDGYALVKVVYSDYPDFNDALGIARIANDHLHIMAQCQDGARRTYDSTRIIGFDPDYYGECTRIKTRGGSEWILA